MDFLRVETLGLVELEPLAERLGAALPGCSAEAEAEERPQEPLGSRLVSRPAELVGAH